MAKIHSEWVESKIYEMKILLDELNSGHDHDHHKVEKQFMGMVNEALEAYRVATILNNTFMNTKAVDVGEGILTVQS